MAGKDGVVEEWLAKVGHYSRMVPVSRVNDVIECLYDSDLVEYLSDIEALHLLSCEWAADIWDLDIGQMCRLV